jgi:hypothetical protein
MTTYVCIDTEINQITSVLNYVPNVPRNISIVEITDEQDKQIKDQTHFFDIVSRTVMPMPQSTLDRQQQDKANIILREFLNSTDWQVMRHIRQKALGIQTTLSDSEYLDLENRRQNAANSIINL